MGESRVPSLNPSKTIVLPGSLLHEKCAGEPGKMCSLLHVQVRLVEAGAVIGQHAVAVLEGVGYAVQRVLGSACVGNI